MKRLQLLLGLLALTVISFTSPVFAAEGFEETRQAAEQGDAKAQYNLGLMYQKGQGVQQDRAEAVKWWRKAAENGEPEAQHYLGFLYGLGLFVEQDEAESVKWCRRAAEQGHTVAQSNLGFAYKQGQGVPMDAVEAYKWYYVAAAKNPSLQGILDDHAATLDAQQRAEGKHRAEAWTPKSELKSRP